MRYSHAIILGFAAVVVGKIIAAALAKYVGLSL
jgi:hypothetical protein